MNLVNHNQPRESAVIKDREMKTLIKYNYEIVSFFGMLGLAVAHFGFGVML